MQNPSYQTLKDDVLDFLRGQSVEGRIHAMILDLVNQALRNQSIQLSNEEKEKLAYAAAHDILQEMLSAYQR